MKSYVEELGAEKNASVEASLITQIDANISQAQSEEERANWEAVKAKLLSDGTALTTAAAAYVKAGLDNFLVTMLYMLMHIKYYKLQ